MTPYYKDLECSAYEHINQQIKDYVKSKGIIESTTNFWNPLPTAEFLKSCPAFYSWLTGLGLKLHSLALTVGKSKECCGAHTDAPPAAHKLSWPIENTTNTFNRWFIPAVDNPSFYIKEGGGKKFTEPDELKEVACREVTGPCIINASIIHDVLCNDDAEFPRLGLQCMLFEEPAL
jgi:hypothetical protein